MQTRSEQTNQIIHLSREVLAGTAEKTALEQALAKLRDDMEAGRQSFAQEDPEVAAKLQFETAAVARAYEAYAAALERLLPATDSGQAEPLEDAIDTLAAATNDWMRAVDAYQARYYTTGPTEYPEMNKLIAFSLDLVNGHLERSAFEAVLISSREFHQQGLEDANRKVLPLSARATEQLTEGFQQHLAALSELERYLQDGKEEHFEAGFAAMAKAQKLIKQGFETRGPMVHSTVLNHLIALCQNTIDGRAQFSELTMALGKARLAMEQERAAFQAEATRQPPSDDVRVRMGEVHESYVACQAALSGLEKSASAADRGGLQRGLTQLRSAAEQLFGASQDFGACLMAQGPTPWVPLNRLMAAVHENIRQPPGGSLADTLPAARECMQACLESASHPPPGQSAQTVALLRDGFSRVLEGLAEAEAYQTDPQVSHLEACEATLRLAVETLQEGMTLAVREIRPLGPTASSQANGFLSAVQAFRDGACQQVTLRHQMQKLDEFLDGARGQVLMLQHTYRDAPPLQVEVIRAQQALDIHERANQAFHKYLETGHVAHLDEGSSLLIEAAAGLDSAARALIDMLVRQDRQSCPRCGSFNELYNRFCTTCKSALPQYGGSDDDEHARSTFALTEVGGLDGGMRPALTENIKKVLEAARQVENGSIGREQFLQVLDWMEAQLAKGLRRAGRLPDVNEEKLAEMEQRDRDLKPAISLATEAFQLLSEGAANLKRGLDELRLYPQDGEPVHLQEGSRMVWDASQEMRHAQHVGELIMSRAEELKQRDPDPWAPQETLQDA